jgi:NodT family efflux transporter outer membrane factor (OMF) lipoprotein
MAAKRAKIWAAGAVAIGLSGCALNERLSKPDLTLPAAFEASAPGGPAAKADLDRWWRLFKDPQLESLINQALLASPDSRSAFFRLKEARAQRNVAITTVLPTGDLQASAFDQYSRQAYSHLNSSFPPQFASFFTAANGSSQTYSGAFNVAWELDLYGKNFTAVRTANAGFAAARFDFEATRMALAAEVASDLFQARGLAVQLRDAQENLKLANSLADAARRKAEAGLATTADQARTASDAQSAEAQAVALEAQLAGARRALLVLIGSGAAASQSLALSPDVTPPPDLPSTTPGLLLVRRPDVREAEENLKEAAGELRLDKLAMFPTLTLQPQLSESRQVESIYTIATRTAAAGVALKAPILSLPKLNAQVRVQGARGQQAVVAYEKAVQTAYGDAERTLTTVAADGRRVHLLEEATKRSRFAFDAANKGYDLGLSDLTTLIQAEQSWRQTRATYTAAQISALVDTVAAFKALGGGWDAVAAEQKKP